MRSCLRASWCFSSIETEDGTTTMNRAYCECGREHQWHTRPLALCPCGRVVEPQTVVEFFRTKQEHMARLALISGLNPSIQRLKGHP